MSQEPLKDVDDDFEDDLENLPIFADRAPTSPGPAPATTTATRSRDSSSRSSGTTPPPSNLLALPLDGNIRPRPADQEPAVGPAGGEHVRRNPGWVDDGLSQIHRRQVQLGTDIPGADLHPQHVSDLDELDWGLVSAFRVQVSRLLSEQLKDKETSTLLQQHHCGREIIANLLEASAQDAMTQGRPTWSIAEQERLAAALFDAVFNLGRLQPLVDDPNIENIEIHGYENVLAEYADGTLQTRAPVAESDADLIGFLSSLGSRREGSTRTFSESTPAMHMRLEDGSRLAAVAWVTPWPVVIIRRNRLRRVNLNDLVARQTMDSTVASFLRAAILAQHSIIISGAQGVGKTTAARALATEIPLHEHIGTFETEYELHLHELRPRVLPFEARPGSGERGLNGRQAGELSLSELLIDSFRMNLDRYIVGEVRGDEILALIKASQSGYGVLATTHSRNAGATIGKLVTCAMEAGAQITERYAERAMCEGIDLVVHIDMNDIPATATSPARRHRYVSEVLAVEWSGDGRKETSIFRTGADKVLRPNVLPDGYRDLQRHGFDLGAYLAGAPR